MKSLILKTLLKLKFTIQYSSHKNADKELTFNFWRAQLFCMIKSAPDDAQAIIGNTCVNFEEA